MLSEVLDRLTIWMRNAAAACLLGMALVTVTDVVGRAFDHPLFGSEEIVTILAVLAVGLSLPYAHQQGSHIGVELVFRTLPKGARRILSALTLALSFVLFVLVAWRMWLYGDTMRESGVLSMNLELPEYLVVYALGIGFVVFALALGRDLLRILRGGGVQ